MAGFCIKNEPKYPSLKNLTSSFGSIPHKPNEFLSSLGAPHIDSFNFAVGEGLTKAVADLDPVEFNLPSGELVSLSLKDLHVLRPTLSDALSLGARTKEVFPTEARQSMTSYQGKLQGYVCCKINNAQFLIEKDFGEIPVMVKSSKCHLSNLSPKDLIEKEEHDDDWGGYFIIQGHERMIRMLMVTRRNYPLSLKRPSWQSRGKLFSEFGVLIRCAQDDETCRNNVLHYVTDGSARFMLMLKRSQYFLPLVLIMKALVDVSDMYIFQKLMAGQEDNQYLKGRCVLIHLNRPEDKFNLLVVMVHKLWGLVQGRCSVDGVDSPQAQEVLVGGYLWLQYLKERLQRFIYLVRMLITKESQNVTFQLNESALKSIVRKSGEVGRYINHFLATGSVSSYTGLGLMQDKGLSVSAENINRMRYMSHFRAVHRGSFFQEMRTTEARQLLPDAWGMDYYGVNVCFICPVHTPDGAPCGLLNHLTKYCQVAPVPEAKLVAKIPDLLVSMGMISIDSVGACAKVHSEFYLVMLDGCVVGYVANEQIRTFVDELRMLKIEGKMVPQTLEIGLIPKVPGDRTQFPGLFLFTGPARLMRPVVNLSCNRIELIGTLEQLYMDISIGPKEFIPGVTTHQELSDTSFLSNLACLIPMPDCNQSPRNMYQCQMGKQTMGTASHVLQKQTESKMYRLQTPTAPLFRPAHHDYINLDNFGMGTNAVVAVISYTGYDMEDAMVINKGSFQRGFAHGSVYKSHIVPLPTKGSYFGLNPQLEVNSEIRRHLDADGLPHVGTRLTNEQPLCSYYDESNGQYVVSCWKSSEVAYIDAVRICDSLGRDKRTGVCLLVRIPRNPNIGDKFASRAGQKGICSMLWPSEDLPFTESGLVPDIVFNPHGFPSRMTIAMMIEVMAGKSGAVHGMVHDATPFRFNEDQTAIDYFGQLLEEGGFNYFGTEKMYSGVSGCEMNAEIFFGIVHYQRLRHMVADKWQVRSTGAIDVVTHQPIKGRKRGGGVRFGEMERDSLLSHGAAFLLQDRLFHCSDRCTTLVCQNCGNIISPLMYVIHKGNHRVTKVECRLCKSKSSVSEMDIPYIYRFLSMQLAAVNINLKLEVGKK
ncbi:DNA-directed RNA polymerase I subunit RPA2 [Gryllus bimaculatus]|nr:DNA-directed RNA polymerase I subunit RPA2 [Gryllus bimaculatus]